MKRKNFRGLSRFVKIHIDSMRFLRISGETISEDSRGVLRILRVKMRFREILLDLPQFSEVFGGSPEFSIIEGEF